MNERLTAHVNLLLMEKANSLPDLACFENPRFYDDLHVVQREAAFRPMILLEQLAHWTFNMVAGASMLVLLARLHPLIAVVLLLFVAPAAFISFALARNAVEGVTSRSPEARKMAYFSSVLLSDAYAKELRIFDLGRFFVGRYRQAFA